MSKLAGVFAAVGIAIATAGTASAADVIKTYDFDGPVANLSAPGNVVDGTFTLDLTKSTIGAFDFSTPFGDLDGSGGLFTKLAGGVDDLTFFGLDNGALNTLNLLFNPSTDKFHESLKIGRLKLTSSDTCVSVFKVCDGARSFTANFTGDARITAVPEPATWAMTLLGLFGLGATLRRARRKEAEALATA